jgi:hypothetical protein
MKLIDLLNNFLNEKDEFSKSSALIDFFSYLRVFNLNKLLFPTNVLIYDKLPGGKVQRPLIRHESEIDPEKGNVLFLLGMEIVSRSKLYSIPLPSQIVYSLTKCAIDWLNYSFSGATVEMYPEHGLSWSNFLDCVLPVYVLSIDGKPHKFKTASGNVRFLRQGWVRHGDLVREVAGKDNSGGCLIKRRPANNKFFRPHPDIRFQTVCRSLFVNFFENQNKCFDRLFWGQTFTMADVQDCLTEALKYLSLSGKTVNEILRCKKCGGPIPLKRRLRGAKYCCPKCGKDFANLRQKLKHR